MPSDQINISPGSTLKFSFSKIDKPLYIHTGADSIKWSYSLNTNIIPTYGGEVVQVLSAFVGPMTISGRTQDNVQQKRITEWFRQYMVMSGYLSGHMNEQSRLEAPILFEYPERGWAFYIQVTDLPNFHYAFDEIAIPWSITAEVFIDNKINTLAQYTMSTFTDVLLKSHLQQIGFSAKDPRTDPTNIANRMVNYQTMGDNFQRLIASYTTGDFSHWGFDILADPSSQFSGTANDIYSKYFGTSMLVDNGDNNQSSGSTTYGGSTNPTTNCGLAHMIAAEFEAQGMPGKLGVATAIVESSLDPNSRLSNGHFGLFQTNDSGRGSGSDYLTNLRDAQTSPNSPVTQDYTAQMQAHDAAKWFKTYRHGRSNDAGWEVMHSWAQEAQSGGVYPHFHDAWNTAGTYLSQNCPENTANGPSGGASLNIAGADKTGHALITAITTHPKFLGTDYGVGGQVYRDITEYQNRGVQLITLQGMLAIMNSGWSLHISALGKNSHSTNDGPRGHWGGLAADFNNYGSGGAANHSGGTSNANPASFISFLKQNRGPLGNISIGYGSGGPEAGADFGDSNTHVHVQWNES